MLGDEVIQDVFEKYFLLTDAVLIFFFFFLTVISHSLEKYTAKTNAWTTKQSGRKKKRNILKLQTVPLLDVLEKLNS